MKNDIISAMKIDWPDYRLLFVVATIPELALVALDVGVWDLRTDEIRFRSANDEAAKRKAAELRKKWTKGNDYQYELLIPSMLIKKMPKEIIIEEYPFNGSNRLNKTLKDISNIGMRERLN